MDKFFEALEKSRGSIAFGITGQIGFDETADVLEKGKKAAMGEIREWNGIRYQKTPGGWIPVKQQEGASKTEPSNEFKGKEGFKKLSDQLKSNQTAVYCQFTGDLKNPEFSKETGHTKKGIVNRVRLLSFNPTTKGSFQVFEARVKYLGDGSIEDVVLSSSQAEKLVSCISKIEKTSEEKKGKVTKEKLESVVADTVMGWIEDMDWDTKPDTGEELLEDDDFVQALFDDWGEAFSPEDENSSDDIRDHWEDVKKVVSEIYDGYMEDHKREDED